MSTRALMLSEDDLSPADEEILDMMQQGRVTAPYVADETEYSLQYVRDRLGRMVEHGNARKVYEGLYELLKDPRYRDDEAQDVESAPTEPVTTDDELPAVAAMSFEKEVTDRRLEVVEEWLAYVRDDGSVQKSDFEGWYSGEHQNRTGYNAKSFWEIFAKPAMRQTEQIEQPNSRSYRWVGEK